ncbi:MAG: ATP-binding protein [Nocardiopsaceae bacterium]|nr:ATP-binding protein [Nocardiopsaceae bacterium]
MRTFNTAGPCDPRRHYMLPAEPRVPGARYIIDTDEYFVIHAPRQTGKTTVLQSLARAINAEGERVALVFSCEEAAVLGDDLDGVMEALVAGITDTARSRQLPPERMPPSPWPEGPAATRLRKGLETWSRSCPLPLVLLIDEIDALSGSALVSVLRQLRAGHNERPQGTPFPASVVLCGMRSIRDYKAASGGNPETMGSASPFNVVVESLRVADFTLDEVAALYGQHTADTGQPFTREAIEMVHEYTRGQPWLVNAIARDATLRTRMAGDRLTPITTSHVDEAKERVIKDRAPHVDSLAARLREPRVQRVIEPLLSGSDFQDADAEYDDDVAYVQDLGLVTVDSGGIQVSSPMYREIIVRILSASAQVAIRLEPQAFLLPDGRIDMGRLLAEFAAFWDEHGEILAASEGYHETAAQLIFMAYLQRVVNGGGYADREYGAGRGWIDILVRKPLAGDDGRAVQKEVIELKVRRAKEADPLDEGLAQLDRYLGAHHLDHGYLVIFDRRPAEVRSHHSAELSDSVTPEGRKVTLLRA